MIVAVFQLLALAVALHLAWRSRPAAGGDPVANAANAALRRGRRAVAWLAARPRRLVLLCFAASIAASALLALRRGLPHPRIHDEFSYLLAADTFAHGRATNPAHPLWPFFETFHVVSQPTYASKYPPAMGAAIALGWAAFGHPIAGVWLSVGLACAAIAWMLLAWLPRPWAVVGSALAVVHLSMTGSGFFDLPGYWSQSYWGGQVAAFGGALLFGGLRRIVGPRRSSARPRLLGPAVAIGIGLCVLATSRPFEGFVTSLPPGIVLLVWLVMGWRDAVTRVPRVVVPIVAAVALLVAGMGAYNREVTGDPRVLPYALHERHYGAGPLFLWQTPRGAPAYNHELLAKGHRSFMFDRWRDQRTPSGFVRGIGRKLSSLATFYFEPIFAIGTVAALRSAARRWTRLAWIVLAVLFGALSLTTGVLPHYAAPVTCLVHYLAVTGWRHVRVSRLGRGLGLRVSRGLPVVALAGVVAALAPARPDPSFATARARIQEDLEGAGGSHVIFVMNGPNQDPELDWVHNDADIETARVVWARDMGAANTALLRHFGGRTAWMLRPDEPSPELTLYPRPVACAGGSCP